MGSQTPIKRLRLRIVKSVERMRSLDARQRRRRRNPSLGERERSLEGQRSVAPSLRPMNSQEPNHARSLSSRCRQAEEE